MKLLSIDPTNGELIESFDEISVGRGWVNEHVKRLVWQDTTRSASVPQIVLLSRMLAAELKPNMAIKVSGDSLVGRLVGYADIVRWVERGARSDDLVNKRGGK